MKAASEIAGDLGSDPNTIRLKDFRGGQWNWKNSNKVIGKEKIVNGNSVAGWRNDFKGHNFGDDSLGPHINVWVDGQETHLFY